MASESKMNTLFKTKTGLTLNLQKVNMDAVSQYIMRMRPLFKDGQLKNSVAELSESEQITVALASSDMLNYVLGWGVKDDPTPEDVEELCAIDSTLNPRLTRVVRATWLRKMVLTAEETSELLAQILTLSTLEE